MDQQKCTQAIDLNNRGALQLEQGEVVSAWESFSQAAQFLVLPAAPSSSPQPTGTGTGTWECPGSSHKQNHDSMSHQAMVTHALLPQDVADHWHWLDCSPKVEAAFWQEETPSSKEGSTPFLFMRVIAISHSSSLSSVSSLSIPILSNLALCCTILGTRLGEQPGRGFLEMAHDLYQKVQGLLEQMEPCSSITAFYSSSSSSASSSPNARMMLLLSMAIANNCACIYFTIKSMPHATMVECLQRLAAMLEYASPIMGLLQAQDRGDLLLNLQILTTSHTVAAAA